jgi:dienelactone hydrolase
MRSPHLRRLICCLAILGLIAGCGKAAVAPAPAAPPTPVATAPLAASLTAARDEDLTHLYDYDANASLGVAETGAKNAGDVKVTSITYASPRGGEARAYLVLPPGKGPFPAVLFMHGIEAGPDQFLDEATALAQKGVAGLLLAAPYTRRSGRQMRGTAEDLDEFVQCVVDLRRGVDLLASLPEIDPSRIGYVGHSYGAIAGGVLSGVEKRIKAYVLMAGAAKWTPWLGRMGIPAASLARMEVTNPAPYVSHAAPAALLLQSGQRDTTFPEQDAKALYDAASSPKTLRWYDADHNLNEQARQDRAEWLASQLGV